MNNKSYYVLVESDLLNLNTTRILGIYDHKSGVDKIQELVQIQNDKKHNLFGPFRLNTAEDSNSSLSKPFSPMPNPDPIVPPIQPDISKITNTDIFPINDMDDYILKHFGHL